MTTTTATHRLDDHTCGGTILKGGAGDQAHLYCDTCGAYALGLEGPVPYGTDKAANQAAWDRGEDSSPWPSDPRATRCIDRTHALALLDELGGWVIDHGDCIWHTDDDGAAEELVLPMVQEDRERARAIVADPRLTEPGQVIDREWVRA